MPDSALFAKAKSIFRERNIFFFFLEIITCIPSIYKIARPDITVSSFMEISIVLKRVKQKEVRFKNIYMYIGSLAQECRNNQTNSMFS